MARPIKTKFSWTNEEVPLELVGWFQGKWTYLWVGRPTKALAYLDGYKLYRLAKAIVREFEKDADNSIL